VLLALGQGLRRGRRFPEAVARLRECVDLRRGLGAADENLVHLAVALKNLGWALRDAEDLAGAADALRESLRLAREQRDRDGELAALTSLGAVLRRDRRPEALDEAIEALSDAKDLAVELEDEPAEARACQSLGKALLDKGRAGDACAALTRALSLQEGGPDGDGLAQLLADLAEACLKNLQAEAARQHLERALGLLEQELRHRPRDRRRVQADKARVLAALGRAHRSAFRHRLAAEKVREAAGLYRAMNDPQREAGALNTLAAVLLDLGDAKAAGERVRQSLSLYEGLRGARNLAGARGAACNTLGMVCQALHQPGEAEKAFGEALACAAEGGGPKNEAIALNSRGEARRQQGRLEEALQDFEASRRLFEPMDDGPRSHAILLPRVGRALLGQGKPREAAEKFREAVSLSERLQIRERKCEALHGLGDALLEMYERGG
jgi:tetratricopeptide (TPR) repeat protein